MDHSLYVCETEIYRWVILSTSVKYKVVDEIVAVILCVTQPPAFIANSFLARRERFQAVYFTKL